MQNNAEQTARLAEEMIERACRAHWPSWDRMRPDIARKWRAKMADALVAAGILEARSALEWCSTLAYAGGKSVGAVEPVKSALGLLGGRWTPDVPA